MKKMKTTRGRDSTGERRRERAVRGERGSPLPDVGDGCGQPPRHRGAMYAAGPDPRSDSITRQLARCLFWAEDHGVEVERFHMFVDRDDGPHAKVRPGLEALDAVTRTGAVDVVIVAAPGGAVDAAVGDLLADACRRGLSCVVIDTDQYPTKEPTPDRQLVRPAADESLTR